MKAHQIKKVFLNISNDPDVFSKKLENTVNIGIATINEIKNDDMYHELIFIYFHPASSIIFKASD